MYLKKWIFILLYSIFLMTLTACTRSPNPKDPYEGFNRKVYAFNHVFDTLIAKPVTKTYTTIVPPPLQAGVSNFYDNFWTPTTIVNDILQGKLGYAVADTWRLLINSTVGILGLFDVASHMKGLPKHYEDLGLTFAYWSGNDGAKTSGYFEVPFLGPFTYRDAFGRVIDTFAFSLWPYIKPKWTAYSLYAGYLINQRAKALPADRMIQTAFDPYVFIRDAYQQHRAALIKANEESYVERMKQENGHSDVAAKDAKLEKNATTQVGGGV